MLRELIARQEEVLPEGHLDTLVSKNDLAITLKARNKSDEAEALYREVLVGFRAVLGDGHLDTLITSNNLAGLVYKRGDIQEAADRYCRRGRQAASKLARQDIGPARACGSLRAIQTG